MDLQERGRRMLKKNEKIFLSMIRSFLLGETEELPPLEEEEWKELFRLAHSQKLLPVIFENARSSRELQKYPQLFQIYREIAIRQVMCQTARSADFAVLYRTLREKGLHPLVVKGELCSALYPLRDYRISADDDLYVAQDELAACHQVMTECGLSADVPEDELAYAQEIGYRSSRNALYIEVHRSLFDLGGRLTEVFNGYFREVFHRSTEQGDFLMMPPHEHLLYLILHAYKHFIHCGVGIRQVCDIGLWARAYAPEIDWELLREQCLAVQADIYAAAVWKIAKKHLGIDVPLPQCWDYGDIEEEAMVADMLKGGIYGKSTMSRVHSSSLTLDAVRAGQGDKGRGVFAALFPERHYMEGSYAYVKKYPVLLPAAWLARGFGYLKEICTTRDSSAAESIQVAKERIILLKQFGIIKEKQED